MKALGKVLKVLGISLAGVVVVVVASLMVGLSGGRAQSEGPKESHQLELVSMTGGPERGFLRVNGEVRNLSSQRLENVVAVVTWRSESGELVKTTEAFVDFNPIMPNQTSTFKSMTTGNPLATQFSVAFKRMGGASLSMKDGRKR